MVPLAWMLSTSLKANGEVFHIPSAGSPRRSFTKLSGCDYLCAFPDLLPQQPFYCRFFGDRCGAVVFAGGVCLCPPARPGKNILFIFLLSTLMLPQK